MIVSNPMMHSRFDTPGEGPVNAPVNDSPSRKWKFLRSRKLLASVLFFVLVLVGTRQYEKLILSPPDDSWRAVTAEDLLSEHWYATAESIRLTRDLEQAIDTPPLRLLNGLYYREYKSRYSPGFKNTQYVRVGPNQFPALHEMVVDACNALGSVDSDPVSLPAVYIGWTGRRSFEVTNFTGPSLVIGNDFLWAFKPDELRYLIARQIGHIHCRHVFFLDVNKGLRSLMESALPDFAARAIIGSFGGKLLDWSKEAHVSADRAGLLVTGDVDVACRALIKLNLLASIDDYYGQPNPEAFAAQTAAILGDRVTLAAAALAEMRNPNPFLTTRVGDLLRFYEANSSLFKDRETGPEQTPFLDPDIVD